MGRSFSLARFGVVGRSGAVVGLFRNPCTCPDLETFFRKMLFEHISRKNASQIGLRIPEEIEPLPYQGQRSQKPASGNERLSKPGSRAEPWCSFLRLSSKESRAPPPESAGNPRCRVHPATVPTEPPTDDRGPGPLSPHFSGEMGTPAGQAGPPGRCAPRPVSALPTRRVRSTGLPLAGGLGWDHRRSRPATWVPARSRAGDPGFL